MPGPALILPGFYGKLPQAGDFVARRLPPAFVRFWDRWCALHLVRRLPDGVPLRFTLAQGTLGAMGLVVGSADRSGRRFPLTVAAPVPRPFVPDPAWFAAIADLAAAAVRGDLGPDTLDERLQALPLAPGAPAIDAPPLTLWVESAAPLGVADPAHPAPALDALLPAPAETG